MSHPGQEDSAEAGAYGQSIPFDDGYTAIPSRQDAEDSFVAPAFADSYAKPRSKNKFADPFQRFQRLWWKNRVEIMHLMAVNVVTTLVMEAVVRGLIVKHFNGDAAYDFFVQGTSGYHVNQQSVTNVWITALTSLFGGPVFFIESLGQRFVFFIFFGSAVSIIGQTLSTFIVGTHLMVASYAVFLKRLMFDFVYNGTIKFAFFEMARKRILVHKPRFSFRTGKVRFTQDFATTLIRVSLLNFFGLKG